MHSPRSDATRHCPAASVLQASCFRGDVTLFRLNAVVVGESGSPSAFRRNTAERVYTTEAAHNPEVAGSNSAPVTAKSTWKRRFRVSLFAVRRGTARSYPAKSG